MLVLSDCCIFMESVSLGGSAFQYPHLHIKTTLAQDSAERERGEQKGKGRVMKGALFPLSLQAWAGMEVYEEGTLMV